MIMHEPSAFAALRGKLSRDAPLARHTTWHVGGNADLGRHLMIGVMTLRFLRYQFKA